MKYFPFEHIIYATHLSEKEVVAILSCSVGYKAAGSFRNGPSKAYEGFVDGNRFTINRVSKNRNSFLPQNTGTIRQDNTATRIEVKMRLHNPVRTFLLFWCLTVTLFLIASLMKPDQDYEEVFLAVIMMLAAYYLLVMTGFRIENKKSGRFFEKLFDAEIVFYK